MKCNFEKTDQYGAVQHGKENSANMALQQLTMRLAQNLSGYAPYMQPGLGMPQQLQNNPQIQRSSVLDYASNTQQTLGMWQRDNIRSETDMRIPVQNQASDPALNPALNPAPSPEINVTTSPDINPASSPDINPAVSPAPSSAFTSASASNSSNSDAWYIIFPF